MSRVKPINLLPWHKAQLRRQNRAYLCMLSLFITMISGALALSEGYFSISRHHWHAQERMQQQRLRQLQPALNHFKQLKNEYLQKKQQQQRINQITCWQQQLECRLRLATNALSDEIRWQNFHLNASQLTLLAESGAKEHFNAGLRQLTATGLFQVNQQNILPSTTQPSDVQLELTLTTL